MFGKDKKKNYFYECFYELGMYATHCFDTLSSKIDLLQVL